MTARCCLRGARLLLLALAGLLPLPARPPSHETLRRWMLRAGLHELRRPVAAAADWIWVIDHSAPVGPDKALLIIGVRRALLLEKRGVLTHQDARVLRLGVTANPTGDQVCAELRALAERVGVPVQVVSDHGGELARGIRLLRRDFPQVIDTYDISHKLACLLRKELEGDPRWRAFLAACARARPRLQQTAGSHLMPPEVRVKARYMALDRQVDWAVRLLAYLDGPPDAALAGRQGVSPGQARAWVEERLGWLRGFRDDVALYAAMMAVVRAAQVEVKAHGIRRSSAGRFARALPAGLPRRGRVAALAGAVKAHLRAEGAKLPDGGHYLGSSDLIESLFGKHKLFTQNRTHRGIGPGLLLLPLLTVEWSAEGIREALEATPFRAVTEWCAAEFGRASPARPPET